MVLQEFQRNDQGRDFAVGDVHGHFDLLMRGLYRVGFDRARDRLFSVGDLIDRGPDSLKCLELAFEPWFHAVCGNHEQMMFDVLLHHANPDLWLLNGGEWIYQVNRDRVRALCEELEPRLPYAIKVNTEGGTFGLVHAEVPNDDWDEIDLAAAQIMIWSRERLQHRRCQPVRGIDRVVCGHTPVTSPIQLGNVHYIDTGAYQSGILTLVELKALVSRP